MVLSARPSLKWVKLGSLSAQLGSPLYPQEQKSPAGPVRSENLHRTGHDHWIGASLRWPMIRRLFWRATVALRIRDRTMTSRPVALGAEPQRPQLLKFSTTATCPCQSAHASTETRTSLSPVREVVDGSATSWRPPPKAGPRGAAVGEEISLARSRGTELAFLAYTQNPVPGGRSDWGMKWVSTGPAAASLGSRRPHLQPLSSASTHARDLGSHRRGP